MKLRFNSCFVGGLLNKRQKKKCNKDCESCRLFEDWDRFSGQYGEYDRCELPPYVYPECKYSSQLEDEYDLPFGGDFREQIRELTGNCVCKHWKRK